MVNIEVKNGIQYNKDYSAFITFKYSPKYVELMRSQPVRYWHSDIKAWEVPYANIDLVINKLSETEYNIKMDKSISEAIENKGNIGIPEDYVFKTKPFAHQIEGIEYGLNHKKFLLGDEQGCIDGDMLVTYNLRGASKTVSLSKLYKIYQNSRYKSDFKIRCLKDGIFGLNHMTDIKYSGEKPVYKISLSDGKFVNATIDHEILTNNGYVPLEKLSVGDIVITNGEMVCPICGSTKDIITYPYAKFRGYCRKCMYESREGTRYKGDEIGTHIGYDGYVYLFGKPLRKHPKYGSAGVPEHVYVMENHLGRILGKDEVVHHINGIKTDNRIENLMVLTVTEHHIIHQKEKHLHKDHVGRSGNMVIVIPKQSTIVSIDYVGIKPTYDIIMDEPYRNFIANKVVVHNCGKTKQMLDLACINKQLYGYKHCLIIACVNGLKYNWQNEVNIHTNESGYILGTRVNRKGIETIGSNKDRLDDLKNIDNIKSYFIITNIETLRYSETVQVPCKTKSPSGKTKYKKVTKFPIVEELQKLYKNGEISMIIADEIHKCKDSNSQQGKALLALNADSMVALTGTPLMNNAIDLYTPLKFIGAENHSLYSFKNHYCILGGFGGHQIVAYKNLSELQALLDTCMIRRLKKDVLDLPEKIYFDDFVEMNNSQNKIYSYVLEDLRANIDRVKLSPNPLTMLIRLRQVTGNPALLSSEAKGNPKFERMLDLVADVVSNGSKAIVFSNWTDVLIPAYELLQKNGYNPALYTGINKDTREQDLQRFKTDSSCKVICGTIGAMGTGLTLTEADTVIFLDEPWNRAIKDQAEDRVHRIGTKSSPNIITIMCKNTIDEKIHDIVYRKGKMSDIIVDKEEDLFKNPSVLNYLLS